MEHRYKFRILPTLQQEQIIEDTFAGCAYLYNYFLTLQLERLREHRRMDYYECVQHLDRMRKENAWMQAVDPAALHHVMTESVREVRRYESAVKAGRTPKPPKPRSHTDIRRSYQVTASQGAVMIGDGIVRIPVLGIVASTVSRTKPLKVTSAFIVQGFNTYYELAIYCTSQETGPGNALQISVGYFSPVEFMEDLRHRRAAAEGDEEK